ncbi:type II toxin-antitoxin system RelE/ParE family toxin [Candidatus Micrarchaeota archaeon]|nr:type II toxin-antitoxin system RelE/ParE family toxin [Candidatus Micrarchaeota archaeon]
MTFSFDLSDSLSEVLSKLAKLDPRRAELIYKKIRQIIESSDSGIEHYKNLRYNLSDYKRVHIDRSFVLIFQVFKTEKHILFISFDHHDKIYKR